MKDRPILFSAPMVLALLDGSKTQTRRMFKAKNGGVWPHKNDIPGMRQIMRNCPYGQPGDRLWVREAWRTSKVADELKPSQLVGGLSNSPVWYEAQDVMPFHPSEFGKLRPSMFMPRWASRILLEITGVSVERLQDISEADAKAEGIERTADGMGWKRGPISGDHPNNAKRTAFPRLAYQSLWESINGPDSWNLNPWVWVIEFKVVQP